MLVDVASLGTEVARVGRAACRTSSIRSSLPFNHESGISVTA